MPQPSPSTGLLEEAQQQAEAAAATLIERKFKEPANLEVMMTRNLRCIALKRTIAGQKFCSRSVYMYSSAHTDSKTFPAVPAYPMDNVCATHSIHEVSSVRCS